MDVLPGLRLSLIAVMVVLVGPALGQRAVVPDRIGWREPYGGSDFARSLHDLSEQGGLNGSPGYPGHGPSWGLYGHYGYSHFRGCSCRSCYVDWDYYPYGVDNRVAFGYQPGSRLMVPAPAPAPAPVPVEPPLEGIDRARVDLAAGRTDDAIRLYRIHVAADPADFAAAAELAVALMMSGRHDDGVSLVRLAYGSDPGLASFPLSDRLVFDNHRWRELVVQVVRHAHRRNTPSAWLAVAVLMQAEGRNPIALRMLDRAVGLGLDAATAGPLSAALR